MFILIFPFQFFYFNIRSFLHFQSKKEAKATGAYTYVSIEKLLSNAFARQVNDVDMLMGI